MLEEAFSTSLPTDDFSRYGYVYLMKYKSESFEKLKIFKNDVQNQLGKSIKALRSDRGVNIWVKNLLIILQIMA